MMSDANEIVEILSSDDESCGPPIAKKARTHYSPGSTECVDLCESSDEEEQDQSLQLPLKTAAAGSTVRPQLSSGTTAATNASHDTQRQLQISRNYDYDSSEDELEIVGAPAFLSKSTATTPAAATASTIMASSPPDVFPSVTQSSTDSRKSVPNPYLSEKKKKKKPPTVFTLDGDIGSDSDSGSDSDIPPSSVFAHRRIVQKSVTSDQSCSQSSSSTKKAFNPYQQSSPPATTSSAEKRVLSTSKPTARVLNPYHNSNRKSPPSQTTTVERPARSLPTMYHRTSPFPYPRLLVNSKQYPDLRAKYTLALWKFGRTLTLKAHERARLDQVVKKMVRLVLNPFPIRSLEEFVSFGRGSATKHQVQEIKQQLETGGLAHIKTPPTRYGSGFYSITEACLVVLYDHARQQFARSTTAELELTDLLADKESWLSVKDLIRLIDRKLRSECPKKLTRHKEEDLGTAFYLEPSTRSVEFMQITKLAADLEDGPRIKRHTKQGDTYYELLELGYIDAERICGRSFPAPPGHYRTSKISHAIEEYKYQNICLGVDLKEGGGACAKLHEMLYKLDMKGVPYFVGSLHIGDYVFFTSNKDKGTDRLDYLCPILIERKSVQDVAMSIYDNRWTSQKARMYKGQYVFGYDNCRMVYIIEGNENRELVTGGYVGARHHNVDKERLQEEIDNLKSEGFDVIRTPSRENTMFELCRWSEKVATEMRANKLTAEYTYQEFKLEVNKIPSGIDFSRLAKLHASKKQEKESAVRNLEKDNKDEKDSSSRKRKSDRSDEFAGHSVAKLKELCKSVGLPMSGTRKDLVDRYCGPHPPKLWRTRKQRGQYVPAGHNTGSTALLVALYLHEKKTGGLDAGMTRDELYVKAEALCITKNPFSGGTTQTGPFHYDGMSNMKYLLKGDPALVVLKKKRYKLTRSCDIAGFKLAEALHTWCHEHENCSCEEGL